MTLLEDRLRGGETDYVLGTLLGWDAFDVVRWHGVEALDELFAFDVLLVRAAERGAVDVAELVDTGATLRIATAARWRAVHGIVEEAEVVEQTDRQHLYRVRLVPHLSRAACRLRCRTFVDKSLEEIVNGVLENRAPKHPMGARGLAPLTGEPRAADDAPSFDRFVEPHASYRWALVDPERAKTPRKLVVQYNESDFTFVSRLLESEGIGYFFEHSADGSVMTLTDRPGHAPLFARDEDHELVGLVEMGAARRQEVVRALRAARRLRPALVTMRDYAWRKSLALLEQSATGEGADDLEHFEYPAADEDEPSAPGRAPARFLLERFEAERAMSEGTSTVRTFEPGYRFRLSDRAGVRDAMDLVIARVESFAQQRSVSGTVAEAEPFGMRQRSLDEPFFENRFEAFRSSARLRPARKTLRPRIYGVQPARVTAEEQGSPPPELNSDELGRVRVRFPWDQRPNDGTPTSKWIRVAQYWAGPGFGALYVPRVGHEVLVAFERGDPDRPIIVGRLYNAQNPPPYVEPNTTKSTLKSDSVGTDGSSADGFNELRFEDAAQKEQVFLHAQRDLDEVVRANHTTSVGGDQSNSVGGNQTNTVQGSREHTVHGTELVHIIGDRTTNFDATEVHVTLGERRTTIGANDLLGVGGMHSIEVNGVRNVHVVGSHNVATDAGYNSVAAEQHAFTSKNCMITQGEAIDMKAGSIISADVCGAMVTVQEGMILINNGAGASIALIGSTIMVSSGDLYSRTGNHSFSASGSNNLSSGSQTIVTATGSLDLSSSGSINASGAAIKLNE